MQQKKQTPRELSDKYGFESLSNEQLLALILRIGTRRNSVYELARVYTMFVTTSLGADVPTKSLQEKSVFGLNRASSSVILALYELLYREKHRADSRLTFTTPLRLAEQFHYLTRKRQEYVYAVYLRPNLTMVSSTLLAKGTTDSVQIEIRDVLYYGIKSRVRNIILIHNHPSGDPTPSNEDIEQTKRIAVGAGSLSMKLMDHIIVGRKGYFSFKESTSVL